MAHAARCRPRHSESRPCSNGARATTPCRRRTNNDDTPLRDGNGFLLTLPEGLVVSSSAPPLLLQNGLSCAINGSKIVCLTTEALPSGGAT